MNLPVLALTKNNRHDESRNLIFLKTSISEILFSSQKQIISSFSVSRYLINYSTIFKTKHTFIIFINFINSQSDILHFRCHLTIIENMEKGTVKNCFFFL